MLLPATNSMLELQKKGFNDDDSALNLWESTKTPLNSLEFWFWKLRVCAFVLELFWVCYDLILTAKREKMESVCVMWLWFCRILTLCAIYSLPCVPASQWACDMWTWTACVALVDWTEKKGLKCNFGKFGTVLQFIKEFGPLKLKLTWTVLKIGIGHFCNKM